MEKQQFASRYENGYSLTYYSFIQISFNQIFHHFKIYLNGKI
jgi:hypothetical protein